MTASSYNIILAAGGTGGHIFPAEALAECLVEQGHKVQLITDQRFHGYFDDAPQHSVFHQVPVHYIQTGRMAGGLIGKLKGGVGVLKGIRQAKALLKSLAPDAVVGFGGYPAFPTMYAAGKLGLKTIIHEQNAVLGRANAKLVNHVDAIATSYQDTLHIPEACTDKVSLTGNPVRASICALRHIPYVAPATDGILRLLVIGGSQGASVFSLVVPQAVSKLPANLRQRLRIDQQCRPEDVDGCKEAYRDLNVSVDITSFFHDMPSRLAAAHLVITRAGASSVAELQCARRPAILVPLPSAMDNHQYFNAQAIEDAEAGWVMPQEGFTGDALAARLESYLTFPVSLQHAANHMATLAKGEASKNLAQLVLQQIHNVQDHSPALLTNASDSSVPPLEKHAS